MYNSNDRNCLLLSIKIHAAFDILHFIADNNIYLKKSYSNTFAYRNCTLVPNIFVVS